MFPLFLRFSLLLLKDKGKQQQFTAKMGNFTPTPSAPTPCKTSRGSPHDAFSAPLSRSEWAIPPVRLGLSGRNSGKTPETLSERFLEFPSRVRLGCPKPYNSRHLRLPERFPEFSPPQYGWGRLFFSELVPERAYQSSSWNSQQYWGYFWLKLGLGKKPTLRIFRGYFSGECLTPLVRTPW